MTDEDENELAGLRKENIKLRSELRARENEVELLAAKLVERDNIIRAQSRAHRAMEELAEKYESINKSQG